MNIAWERLRDPKVWVLFFAFIKLLSAAVGIDIASEQWAEWEAVFNGACGIAVALGIFQYNPQTGGKS